jgi:mRNA interferase MazF
MVSPRRVKRGEVWLVNLDPTIGSEIQKTRPCVVISPPEMHDYLRTAIIAPMTTGSHPAPFRIPVRHGGKNGLILLDEIRAIDKTRLVKRTGAVTPSILSATLAVLAEIFAVADWLRIARRDARQKLTFRSGNHVIWIFVVETLCCPVI